jgi:hypothetical protein
VSSQPVVMIIVASRAITDRLAPIILLNDFTLSSNSSDF